MTMLEAHKEATRRCGCPTSEVERLFTLLTKSDLLPEDHLAEVIPGHEETVILDILAESARLALEQSSKKSRR